MARPRKLHPKPHQRGWHEGTVKLVRPGVWRAWRARVHRPDGTSARPSRTFYGADAEARAASWALGEPETAVMYVGQWLERWYSLRAPSLRPNSRRIYRRAIEACKPLAEYPIHEAYTDEWQMLANALLGRWTRKTVYTWKGIISSAMRAAVPRYLAVNPIPGVRLPAADERKVRAWTADEVSRLLAAARGYKHEAWLWLSFGTGTRIGESRGLEKTDLDFAAKTVHIHQSYDAHTNEAGPTKTGKSRTVDLPDELIAVLQVHLARQNPSERFVFGSRQKGGGPHTVASLRGWLLRLCARAGVVYHPSHSTRHTFATQALEDPDVPLKEVSEALGHSNVAITAAIYSHAIETRRRRAANAIGRLLVRRPGTVTALNLAHGSQLGTREDG